jgi:hypothetical protein
MSKRTREEEGLALALASPECSQSSAALMSFVSPLGSHPDSGGLTRDSKSIARAVNGWTEPVIRTWHKLLLKRALYRNAARYQPPV